MFELFNSAGQVGVGAVSDTDKAGQWCLVTTTTFTREHYYVGRLAKLVPMGAWLGEVHNRPHPKTGALKTPDPGLFFIPMGRIESIQVLPSNVDPVKVLDAVVITQG